MRPQRKHKKALNERKSSLSRTLYACEMSSSDIESLKDADIEKVGIESPSVDDDPDAEFGGREARQRLERKLLRKVDLRMSVLVVIYILNYVSMRLIDMCGSNQFL